MGETQKRSDKDHRPQITDSEIRIAHDIVLKRLFERLEEKGYGAWVSRHEVLGFLTEEYKEVVDAVHDETLQEILKELEDVAVGCIFAIACIRSGNMDW